MENQIGIFDQLPHAPAFVEGVTNLRGKVLLVIDLRKRFALPAQETEVGMIVDEVLEVLTVPEGAVKAAPAIATTVDTSFIKGIAKIEERLVILLDLNCVLAKNEQLSLQSV